MDPRDIKRQEALDQVKAGLKQVYSAGDWRDREKYNKVDPFKFRFHDIYFDEEYFIASQADADEVYRVMLGDEVVDQMIADREKKAASIADKNEESEVGDSAKRDSVS